MITVMSLHLPLRVGLLSLSLCASPIRKRASKARAGLKGIFEEEETSHFDDTVFFLTKMNPSDNDAITANEHCGFSQRGISNPSEQKNDEGLANQNIKAHGSDTPCDTVTAEVGAHHDTTEVQDGFWLSEKPYFHFILSKAHLQRLQRLALPAKIHHVLPEQVVPVVLTCQKKNWEMGYVGDSVPKRFDSGWRNFVVDNDIRVGDCVVLELLECSEALIKFRVQILSGDIPPEVLDKADGRTPNNPIVIE